MSSYEVINERIWRPSFSIDCFSGSFGFTLSIPYNSPIPADSFINNLSVICFLNVSLCYSLMNYEKRSPESSVFIKPLTNFLYKPALNTMLNNPTSFFIIFKFNGNSPISTKFTISISYVVSSEASF